MLSPEISDRDMVKFPKIAHKSKSVPGNPRSNASREALSAKAWFYCTPNAQFGTNSPLCRFQIQCET